MNLLNLNFDFIENQMFTPLLKVPIKKDREKRS